MVISIAYFVQKSLTLLQVMCVFCTSINQLQRNLRLYEIKCVKEMKEGQLSLLKLSVSGSHQAP